MHTTPAQAREALLMMFQTFYPETLAYLDEATSNIAASRSNTMVLPLSERTTLDEDQPEELSPGNCAWYLKTLGFDAVAHSNANIVLAIPPI